MVEEMCIWTRLAAFAEVETERTILRPFRYQDVDDFYAIVTNPDNLAFIFPVQASYEQAEELLVSLFMTKPLGVWAIEDKASGSMIGAIRFEKISPTGKKADLGYFLHQDYWGQGLMTEIVKGLVFLAFSQFGMEEIAIVTHLENQASQAVAKKAGFVLESQYRGSDRYSHRMRDYKRYVIRKSHYSLKENEEENDHT